MKFTDVTLTGEDSCITDHSVDIGSWEAMSTVTSYIDFANSKNIVKKHHMWGEYIDLFAWKAEMCNKSVQKILPGKVL